MNFRTARTIKHFFLSMAISFLELNTNSDGNKIEDTNRNRNWNRKRNRTETHAELSDSLTNNLSASKQKKSVGVREWKGRGRKRGMVVRQAIRNSRKTNDYQMLFFSFSLHYFSFVGKSQLKVELGQVTGWIHLLCWWSMRLETERETAREKERPCGTWQIY